MIFVLVYNKSVFHNQWFTWILNKTIEDIFLENFNIKNLQ